MARKTYSEEFRRDAVEVYRSTPGATVVGIAGDLGIMDSTLSTWLQVASWASDDPRITDLTWSESGRASIWFGQASN